MAIMALRVIRVNMLSQWSGRLGPSDQDRASVLRVVGESSRRRIVVYPVMAMEICPRAQFCTAVPRNPSGNLRMSIHNAAAAVAALRHRGVPQAIRTFRADGTDAEQDHAAA